MNKRRPQSASGNGAPRKSDWGSVNRHDLDAACAYRNFAGKSAEQAEQLFIENALFYQEDLFSMPQVAFNYYAPVFARYLLSNKAEGDSDGASSFLDMVLELLQTNRSMMNGETYQILIQTAKEVAAKQEFYDADIDIYGEFSERYQRLSKLC